MLNKAILREYDIRGIVGKDFDKEDVYLIGRAYGSILVRKGLKVVCTNYDGRPSSKSFSEAMNKGLSECGLKVLSAGMSTSPMHYYAIAELNADAGAMITASHNPKEYNGIKFNLANNFPFFGEDVQSSLSHVIVPDATLDLLPAAKHTEETVLDTLDDDVRTTNSRIGACIVLAKELDGCEIYVPDPPPSDLP